MTTALERRVEALEAASPPGDGGCDRCCGVLVVVSNVITREVHSASWNGESITEEEAHEHHTEQKCARCGRKLEETPVIKVGGLRERPGPQVRETSPDLSEELLQNNLMEQCACNSMTASLSASWEG